jgi:hypothetical protein
MFDRFQIETERPRLVENDRDRTSHETTFPRVAGP